MFRWMSAPVLERLNYDQPNERIPLEHQIQDVRSCIGAAQLRPIIPEYISGGSHPDVRSCIGAAQLRPTWWRRTRWRGWRMSAPVLERLNYDYQGGDTSGPALVNVRSCIGAAQLRPSSSSASSTSVSANSAPVLERLNYDPATLQPPWP